MNLNSLLKAIKIQRKQKNRFNESVRSEDIAISEISVMIDMCSPRWAYSSGSITPINCCNVES